MNTLSSSQGRFPPPSPLLIALFLAALITLEAWLSISGVGVWHYSPDELNHIEMAQGKTWGEVLRFSQQETHPPLGQLLRHCWMQLGDAPWFQRSFSLIFGLALIPLYYRMGTKLSDPWTGLGCATLIAFSHGCIVQSYIVRNYTFFLFLLSLNLYAGLLWRRRPQPSLLVAYTFFGCLATLTNFSGLFGIFCVFLVEGLRLLRQHGWGRMLMEWLGVNALIAAITLVAMYIWRPLLTLTLQQIHAITGAYGDWHYPFLVMDYLFVFRDNQAYAAVLSAFVLCTLYMLARRVPSHRSWTVLAGTSLLLGTAVVAGGWFYAETDRHSLWLLPYFILPLGYALGLAMERASRFILPAGALAAFLMLGVITQSQSARFRDISEYMMTQKTWENYTHYLSGLDSSHLIVASRTDAFLTTYPEANLYYYYTGGTAPYNVLVRYYHTHLLFSPYDLRYSTKDLARILLTANANGQLKGVTTLVFTFTSWPNDAVVALSHCAALGKTVVSFSPRGEPAAGVLLLSRQELFNQLLSSKGTAHDCMATDKP